MTIEEISAAIEALNAGKLEELYERIYYDIQKK